MLNMTKESLQGDNLFKSKLYRIYNSGKRNGAWEQKIDWGRIESSAMSEEKLEYSWKIASLSSNVEMLGMKNAADLLIKCEDKALCFGLAQAVNDEARHCEVFTKYAQKVKGYVLNVTEEKTPVHAHFDKLEAFDDIFLSHVHLENLALESFSIFVDMYKGELIGDLYKGAIKDEARHVTMGAAYFKQKIQKDPSLRLKYVNHHKIYSEIFTLSKESAFKLAELSNIKTNDIIKRMTERTEHFVAKITGLAPL